MKEIERDKLLKEKQGYLDYYNLWTFWEGISKNHQDKIFEYFESVPLMWDYKNLFKGNFQESFDSHGPLHIITMLLELDGRNYRIFDIIYIDYYFSKFNEYDAINYSKNSHWGNDFDNTIYGVIKAMENSIKTDEEDGYTSSFDKYSVLERLKNTTYEDIYWYDSYFFIMAYSKLVYKCYLDGLCDIERFLNAVNFTLANLDKLKLAVTKMLDLKSEKLHNGVIEQYLIYLEKQKMYKECHDVILQIKDKGWNNDIEKRLTRCKSKM